MRALLKRLLVGFVTGELIRSLWRGPNWWVVPFVLVLLPIVLVFLLLQAVPVVAPFVYTAF
jgi:hypothetical protein